MNPDERRELGSGEWSGSAAVQVAVDGGEDIDKEGVFARRDGLGLVRDLNADSTVAVAGAVQHAIVGQRRRGLLEAQRADRRRGERDTPAIHRGASQSGLSHAVWLSVRWALRLEISSAGEQWGTRRRT